MSDLNASKRQLTRNDILAMAPLIPYTRYDFLFPPRPENPISSASFDTYTYLGYFAQKKKNGTNTPIFAKGKEVIFKKRDGTDQKQWRPLREHIEFFSRFKDWHVFCAELLHSKVTDGPKNVLYIYDMIVADGMQLVGKTFAERQVMMYDLLYKDPIRIEDDQIWLTNKIALARTYDPRPGRDLSWLIRGESFAYTFAEKLQAEDEGLVLKDPMAKLEPCFREVANRDWQVKARIPTSNYSK